MVNKSDVSRVHPARVSAGEVGVGVVGVGLDLLIAERDSRVSEGLDAIPCSLRDRYRALGGKKRVVRVIGRVEQVLPVKLTEDERHQNVAGSDCGLWVGLLDSLEPGKRSVIVEVVKVFVRLAGLRSKVDGVRVGGGVIGICGGRALPGEEQARGQGWLRLRFMMPLRGQARFPRIALRSNIAFPLSMIRQEGVNSLLDAEAVRLYPLILEKLSYRDLPSG